MLYKLKIYRWGWYKFNGRYQKLSKEYIWDIITGLNLKSVRSVKKNKKPYIMVKLTSEEEYIRLKRQMKRFRL